MKKIYVADLTNRTDMGSNVVLYGWIKAKRHHGNILFLDICDSTGSIQAVVERKKVAEKNFELSKSIPLESAVKITGTLIKSRALEISTEKIEIIGLATISIDPQPRSEINIFDSNLQEQLLDKRHLYLRNEKMMAILRFRHLLMNAIRDWFNENGFVEIAAPILTPIPLYDDRSAIPLEVRGQKIFLTQCVGFYLEGAVHAFEKVYNIGPSFRGEESRSKRHLMEYWHVKAEVAFGDLEDIISVVENLIAYVSNRCSREGKKIAIEIGTEICLDGLNRPYSRISYSEAIPLLQRHGLYPEFGKSLGTDEETFLSSSFSKPFWIMGIPRSIEPFPYVINSDDPRVTKTADLIATRGFGELLGVAEKIHDPQMLDERMQEKNKLGNPQYEWLRELRQYGCVPHIGFGLGVERLIRWLLQLPHVRDAIPFPRIFRRKIHL